MLTDYAKSRVIFYLKLGSFFRTNPFEVSHVGYLHLTKSSWHLFLWYSQFLFKIEAFIYINYRLIENWNHFETGIEMALYLFFEVAWTFNVLHFIYLWLYKERIAWNFNRCLYFYAKYTRRLGVKPPNFDLFGFYLKYLGPGPYLQSFATAWLGFFNPDLFQFHSSLVESNSGQYMLVFYDFCLIFIGWNTCLSMYYPFFMMAYPMKEFLIEMARCKNPNCSKKDLRINVKKLQKYQKKHPFLLYRCVYLLMKECSNWSEEALLPTFVLTTNLLTTAMGYSTVRMFSKSVDTNFFEGLMYPCTGLFTWGISSVVYYEAGNVNSFSKEFLALAKYEDMSIEETKFLKALQPSSIKIGSSYPIARSDVLHYSSVEFSNIVNLLVLSRSAFNHGQPK